MAGHSLGAEDEGPRRSYHTYDKDLGLCISSLHRQHEITCQAYASNDDAASGECEAAGVDTEADHANKVLKLNHEMCDVVAVVSQRSACAPGGRESILYTATMVWLLARSTRNRHNLARARLTRALLQSIVQFWPIVDSGTTAALLTVERLLAALWILPFTAGGFLYIFLLEM